MTPSSCCGLACLQGCAQGIVFPSLLRYLDSREENRFQFNVFIFVLNNAVSRLIVKQILREVEPKADTARRGYQSHRVREGSGVQASVGLAQDSLSPPCLALSKSGHLWGESVRYQRIES